MLRHDSGSVLVFHTRTADNTNFFNGNYNTLELDFDPLVTGYAFFKWTKIPKWVETVFPAFKTMTEKNFLSGFSLADIELETTTIQAGFSGNEYNVATNSKKNNTDFSIKHREFSGSPMRNMYQYWITGIRDPETGIATYPKVHGVDYAAKNHTGEIIYIVTRPDANNVDMNNIEFACYFTAVMPTKIQLSQFNYDTASHDAVEYEQSFKGCYHMSPEVDSLAKSQLQQVSYGMVELGEWSPSHGSNHKATLGSGFNGSFAGNSGEYADSGVASTL
jgi:hypothetical protein